MNKQQKGFTIIEVVLVLAIAGLIFLMVFIALPALQRGQRDTQRENDLSRFMAAVNSYQSNNRGEVPAATAAGIASGTGLVGKYLEVDGDTFEDPKGNTYTFVYGTGASPDTGQVRYATNARCGADGEIVSGSGNRQVAASVGLEGGGAHCQQN